MPSQEGSRAWHMEQRPSTASWTAAKPLAAANFCWAGRQRSLRRIVLEAVEHGRGRKPHHQHKQDARHDPKPENIALPGVQRIEVMADGDAHQKDQTRNRPVVLGGEGQRVMVRQHQEENGQRQVIIMGRAELGDFAVCRVWRAPGLQIRHHDFLIGDDDERTHSRT